MTTLIVSFAVGVASLSIGYLVGKWRGMWLLVRAMRLVDDSDQMIERLQEMVDNMEEEKES